MIRSFNCPVLFNSRTLQVYVVTPLCPIHWRKLVWKVRAQKERARQVGWEVVLPGYAVPAVPEFTKIV